MQSNEILATYKSNLEASKIEGLNPNTIKYRILKGITKDGILFRYSV